MSAMDREQNQPDLSLPRSGQFCEVCSEEGHYFCFPERSGPDDEHLFMSLNDAVLKVDAA